MRCPSDSAFEKFIGGQLSPAREQRIAAHLETCAACSQRLELLSGGEEIRSVKPSGGSEGTENGQTAHDLGHEHVTSAELEDWRDDLYQLAASETDLEVFSAEPTSDLFRLLTAESTDDVAGVRLGHFTVRRWLGGGGFGVVFLADDELLHREVALKLPRGQVLAHRETRRRFLREAEAAAQLHHPNLVPVFETGSQQGICYIASQYCSGPTLQAWRIQQTEPVPVSTAVTMLRQLTEAVQHAHDQGVLHRDIKPSNVLLEPNAANPHAPIPRITDFGLAKLLDPAASDVSMLGSHGLLGTPGYMAPEQAGGSRADLGPATDVFGLGALLYELLVGVAPYAGEDRIKSLQRLYYDPVVPPRRLRSDVPRDLEAICLRCLEKRPKDRYSTARELGDDLRRFAEGHATRARPIGQLERLRRWTIREPAVAALLAVSVVGLLTLLGTYVAYSRSLESFNAEVQTALDETRQAQRIMETQRERLQRLLYISKIELAQQAIQENDLRQAWQLLSEIREQAAGVADDFVWRYLWNRVSSPGQEIVQSDAAIYDVKVSDSGNHLAACGADSILRVYDGRSFEPLLSIATEQGEINGVAFSPDERLLATAGDDGTIRLWRTQTGEPHGIIQAHDGFAYEVVFTPDGATLISCGDEPVIRRWDVRTGDSQGTLEGHSRAVEAIELAENGKHLASASSDFTARIWNLDSGTTTHVLEGHQGRVIDVRYSPGDTYVLTGSIDHTVRLWQASDGTCLQTKNHVDAITSVAFRDDGAQLLASDRGGSVHLWRRELGGLAADPASGPLHSWKAHQGRAWDITTTARRGGVLTAGADGKVNYWPRPPGVEHSLELAQIYEIRDVVFDPDSPQLLHFIHSEKGVQTWNLSSGRQRSATPQTEVSTRQPVALCVLPGDVLVTAFSNGALETTDLSSGETTLELQTPWKLGKQPLDDLAASQDGRRLAVFSYARDATLVFDLTQPRLLASFDAYSKTVALSADGKQLAMSDGDDVVVWQVDQPQEATRFRGHSSSIMSLQFSPDGRWLASGSNDRHVRLWDLRGTGTGQSEILSGHRDEVRAVAFSPDGRLLASGDSHGVVKFWLLAETSELLSLDESAPIRSLVFSPAGDRLAIHTAQQIRILDARIGPFAR